MQDHKQRIRVPKRPASAHPRSVAPTVPELWLGLAIRRAVLLLLLVFSVGVAGYVLIVGMDILEAVYFTTITLSTVGLGTPREAFGVGGKVFTVVLIWGGVGLVAYLLTQVVAFVVSGQLNRIVRARRMEKVIGHLSGHFIVCGTDEAAQQAMAELKTSGRMVVLISEGGDRASQLQSRFGDLLSVRGLATESETLERANIAGASTLIACLPTDAENLFLVLTARELAPEILIIAQATDPASVHKLRKVGANHVVAPELIAGTRMASFALRPTALAFLDVLAQPGEEALRLEEVGIPEESRWAGATLAEIRIPQQAQLLVIGMRKAAAPGRFVFNPSGGEAVSPGDALIVLGTHEQKAKLESLLSKA